MGDKKTIQCPFCCRKITVAQGDICTFTDCMSYKNKLKLPKEAFTHKLFPIIIGGAISSGKTHYLTTLLHILRSGYWKDYGFWKDYWTWKPIDYIYDPTTNDPRVGNPYRRDEETLYKSHYTLPSTKATGDHPPMFLSLSYKSPIKHLFDEPLEPWRKGNWLITITDTAGEDSERGDIDFFDNKYLASKNAKGLIIMMDAAEVLGGASKAFNIVSDQRRKKSSIPAAFCLSKVDELEDKHFEDLPTWLFDRTRDTDLSVEGKLMRPDIEENSQDIDSFLRKRKGGCEAVVKSLGSFDYYACFGVSALGIDPFVKGQKGIKLKDNYPQPFHVLDPLLWILWQHGLLGGAKRRG